MASNGTVQRINLTDDEQRLIGEDDSNAPENQEWFRGCRVFYTLPTWRLSTFLRLALLMDIIITNALWLTGIHVTFIIFARFGSFQTLATSKV